MRTSPPGMQRPRRRAPLVLLSSLALVVAVGAGCADDGDDDASPTTTSPSTEASEAGDGDGATTTTAEAPDGTEATAATEQVEPGAIPGDDADVLTAEQAQAQLEALVAEYRRVVAESARARALDERTLAGLAGAFTGATAQTELDGLQQAGVETLNPTPPEVTVDGVEITDATGGCAAGTATIEGISGFVTTPVETIQPYYFRLVPAADGAAAPAWRIAFLRWTSDGVAPGEASCS